MLIGFEFRNFRSFLEPQNFSFSTSPGRGRGHFPGHHIDTGLKAVPHVSRAAIVVGSNAGGKTNFVSALAAMRELVLHSMNYSDTEYAEMHTPYQFGESASQATHFKIDLLHLGVRYRYNFSYDAQRILSETLLVYHTGKPQQWFARHYDEASQSQVWAPFSANFGGPKETWRQSTRNNALFLTTAGHLNAEQLLPLCSWFEHCLKVLLSTDFQDLNRLAPDLQDPEFKTQFIEFLRLVDMQVDDVRVTGSPNGERLAENIRVPSLRHLDRSKATHSRPMIEFQYALNGTAGLWLESKFEAAGLYRMLVLFKHLSAAFRNDNLLVIDEFDASLHPLVASILIELLYETALSGRGSQMLVTSHNVALIDMDILRREEIWLVQRIGKGPSRLRSIDQLPQRNLKLTAKAYLSGRYNAVAVPEPG